MPNDTPPPLPAPTSSGASPLADTDITFWRQVVADVGLTEAARQYDLPRHTMAAAIGGACVREGTRLVFADRRRRCAATGA